MNKNTSTRTVLIEKVIMVQLDLKIAGLYAYYQVRKCYDIKEVLDGFTMLGIPIPPGSYESEDFYVILSNENFGALLHKDNFKAIKK